MTNVADEEGRTLSAEPSAPPNAESAADQPTTRAPQKATGVPTTEHVPIRSLLRNLEFRTMSIAQFFSLAGDQMARVALSVIVFDRTSSALEAAIAYALTFVPAALGGPLLAGLADRRPRRSVMIACDLIRAPLIGLLAIPSIPIPLALVLLGAAGLFEAPFSAARSALLPDVLPGERFPAGLAFSQVITQAAQVGGFGLAGVLLIGLSPATLLMLDAATFVLSAVLLAQGVLQRPAAVEAPDSHREHWWTHAWGDLQLSLRLVLRNPALRSLAVLAWASITFTISFEALGAPLARATHSAPWAVGVLLAAQPVGTVSGALLVTRVPAPHRASVMRLLAVLSLAPLLLGFIRPPLAVLLVMGVLTGLGIAFNILASTAFVTQVKPEVRGRAIGLVSTGMLVGQGLGVLAAGSLATAIDPRITVAWMSLLGLVAVVFAIWDGARTTRSQNAEN
jgi:MFS family permease